MVTSPAIKLARELCICAVVDGCIVPARPSEGLFIRQLERFHTKAQAQALRDAAEKLDEQIHDVTDSVEWLRRMADELEAGK